MIGSAVGKIILFGEHSVLYGYPAVAMGMKDSFLNVVLEFRNSTLLENLEIRMEFLGETTAQTANPNLRTAIAMAIQESQCTRLPSHLTVRSAIPLGAGMGGSAALAVALLRAFRTASDLPAFNEEELVSRANRIDSIFHGKASGLDVTTVVHESPIWFRKETRPRILNVSRPFWIAALDSKVRVSTMDMVQSVRALSESPRVKHLLAELGQQTEFGCVALESGDLHAVGNHMNRSHEYLTELGVSGTALNNCVTLLRKHGALGAKLTGGGGGGLAIGLFDKYPESPVKDLGLCIARFG